MTESETMSAAPATTTGKVRLPPRWFIRAFWFAHRRFFRVTGGRGLWRPKPGKWGAMRVTTIGRKTGKPHPVILGYFEDGPNLATMAMNGWMDGDPAWWLNLQAHPDVQVEVVGSSGMFRAHRAEGDERTRLWSIWQQIDKNLDSYAARRSTEAAVVVFEPLAAP